MSPDFGIAPPPSLGAVLLYWFLLFFSKFESYLSLISAFSYQSTTDKEAQWTAGSWELTTDYSYRTKFVFKTFFNVFFRDYHEFFLY